ncbi:MAG: phosphoketolase family protein [Candidatus Dojkabacteria bacterium]|nr:phosphoketolase family protein [Candidatus Dojkabacteria bacterium]
MNIERSEWLKKYFDFANYICLAMLYLKDNFFLTRDLKKEDLKDRILGHWGTVPGLNLIYGALNIFIKENKIPVTLVTGPGHGAPAILTGLFLEGTIQDFYKKYTLDLDGLGNLIKDFSWPDGFPSHTTAMLPGNIHEGGELGYSLATAYGIALDNPGNLIVCIVGDGEAETATLAASWHCNKFINPVKDGIVLPILHLNGYKISGPTIFSSMSEIEITNYFTGIGYEPIFIDQYKIGDKIFETINVGIDYAWKKIQQVKNNWSTYMDTTPNFPIIILKTKKGWTAPVEFKGKPIEDHNNSHGIPINNPKNNEEEFEILKLWLGKYNVHQFIEKNTIKQEIFYYLSNHELNIGRSKLINQTIQQIKLPDPENESLKIFKKGDRLEKRMEYLAEYLRDIFLENYPVNNFKIFSPDESESNALSALFSATDRIYTWPIRQNDHYFSDEGNIIEILSENVLQAMFSGYTLSGRYGILISYEAFLNVISSQIDQHIKFLKQLTRIPWRNAVPSLNLVATSTLWRQEHNGFSHQNPTLINSLLTKFYDKVKIFFPADVNTMLITIYKCLQSTNGVNLIVVCKRDLPQYFTYHEAVQHVENGISELDWVSTLTQTNEHPDVVLVSIGDYQTNECIKAIQILEKYLSNINIRFLNVNEISQYSFGSKNNILQDNILLQKLFTADKDVIINFHGYPTAIQQLFFNKIENSRLKILGYVEEGTTTTPLNMQIMNGTSRFHVCIKIAESIKKHISNKTFNEIVSDMYNNIQQNLEYSNKYGIDAFSIY